jgi:hypothetical protein
MEDVNEGYARLHFGPPSYECHTEGCPRNPIRRKLFFILPNCRALGETPPDRPPVSFPHPFDLGYRGSFPRIALWWERDGDELASFDGQSMTCGLLDNYLFLDWIHSLPIETREALRIGDSENEAVNCLLVNLRTETVELQPRRETILKLRAEA